MQSATQSLDLSAVAWTRNPGLPRFVGSPSPPLRSFTTTLSTHEIVLDKLWILTASSYSFETGSDRLTNVAAEPHSTSVADPRPLGICGVGTRMVKTSVAPARVPSLLDLLYLSKGPGIALTQTTITFENRTSEVFTDLARFALRKSIQLPPMYGRRETRRTSTSSRPPLPHCRPHGPR